MMMHVLLELKLVPKNKSSAYHWCGIDRIDRRAGIPASLY